VLFLVVLACGCFEPVKRLAGKVVSEMIYDVCVKPTPLTQLSAGGDILQPVGRRQTVSLV